MAERLRETAENVVERNGIKATRLCTHRDDVEHINSEQLQKLPGEKLTFHAVDSDPNFSKFMESHTPVLGTMVLKVGAQVMLMKNIDISKGLVNGARGVIVSFKNGSEGRYL